MRYIILFSLFFVGLGCSNNDNDAIQEEEQEQNIELKIKKFTITDVAENYRQEYSFDEDAKPITYFNTLDGIDGIKLEVSYSTSGQLAGVAAVTIVQGQTKSWFNTVYQYNTSNEIVQINRFDEYGDDFGFLVATHFQDSIQVHREFATDNIIDFTLIFGTGSQLIQENLQPHPWNPNPTVTKYTYSDENLINLYKESGTNISDLNFEHDDKINPLYPVFIRDYRSFILDDLGVFLAFNRTYSSSENNITTYNDEFGAVLTITYQYNTMGFPVSAEVFYNGQLFQVFSYEYY